ncbi:DUF223 domain protein [Medicago truncatula]|uniref:DUF223 domain protein n=1 Tax=Medicago truncatula TaxID=3880 RepID=G7LDT9_MEDTR|nr:DUF223 domain protein [Medicago truncatula]
MIFSKTRLVALDPDKTNCSIMVRVLRLWDVESTLMPGRVNSSELLLMDIEGYRMHATVPPFCVEKFRHMLVENRVYIITMFSVLPNLDEFMSTSSAYRIVFHQDTDLMATTCSAIPECRLSLITSADLLKKTRGCSYAVDVIGLLTAMHHEYFLDSTNHLSSVLKFELTDERTKFECALTGKYIGIFHELLKKVQLRLPIVVIQFARVIAENGTPVVCAEKDITKVSFNPTIPEVTQFQDRLLIAGPKSSIVKFNPNFRMSVDVSLSFSKMYPKKSIKELLVPPEGGFFVVCARVAGFRKVDQWFYPVCDCNSFMGNEFGFYLCDVCHRTSFNVTPKFRFELSVEDDGGVAIFHILDRILLDISSLKCSFLDRKLPLTRGHLQKLNGRECMFLVKKYHAARFLPGYGFDVLRVSDDSKVVRSYYDEGRSYTPSKVSFVYQLFFPMFQAIFQPSFEEKGPMPVIALRAPPAARRVSPFEKIVYKRRGSKKVCDAPGQSTAVSGFRKSNRILARRKLLGMFDKLSAADKSDV